MRRLVTRSTVLLGAAVLAGCSFSFSTGGSDTLDADKIEGAISSQVRKENPDLPVKSVTCPDGIKPAQGVTLECTVKVDSAQWPVGVTITQVDVGEGRVDYSFKPTKALLNSERIVNTMKVLLPDQGVPNAKVDCGTGRYRVVEVGGAVECTVSAGGKRRVARAVVKDVDGTVNFEWAD